MSGESLKNPPRKEQDVQPKHDKHGQEALIENVLELVDANLEGLPQPGEKESNQQPPAKP